MHALRTLGCCASIAALAVLMVPTAAHACGGTFCDAGPQPMPVDQTGENILFVMRDGTVEAHVQIQYQGDPERFAWIVPVMAIPEIEPGSDQLFQNLLTATVPTFTLGTTFEDCPDDVDSAPIACFASSKDDSGSSAFPGDGGDGLPEGSPEDDGPDVVRRGTAGAFEYAVLEGGTVEGVVQWLADNGYQQDDDAGPLLSDYIDDDFVFVAFKLRAGTGVEEIHPVVIRYAGDEPCVPIRLTRIAAVDDMGIRAFFLGDARAVPTNYRHVELNPLKLDWLNVGANYQTAVTLAVDEDGADGHAFVTEYAGSSDIVAAQNLVDSRWRSDAFIDIAATAVVDELDVQGLLDCNGAQCQFFHPLVQGLLDMYLPRPAGLSEEQFYSCLSCYEELIDPEAWSGPGFAADLEERVIGPAEHAADLLWRNPYLTRLYTTLSPHEMTEDPLFHENDDLPDVSADWSATQVIACEGNDYILLENDRVLFLEGNVGVAPEFADMPWAERIEMVPATGAPLIEVDHRDAIDEELDAWNAAHDNDEGGCNCRIGGSNLWGLLYTGALIGFAWRGRRRRR